MRILLSLQRGNYSQEMLLQFNFQLQIWTWTVYAEGHICFRFFHIQKFNQLPKIENHKYIYNKKLLAQIPSNSIFRIGNFANVSVVEAIVSGSEVKEIIGCKSAVVPVTGWAELLHFIGRGKYAGGMKTSRRCEEQSCEYLDSTNAVSDVNKFVQHWIDTHLNYN